MIDLAELAELSPYSTGHLRACVKLNFHLKKKIWVKLLFALYFVVFALCVGVKRRRKIISFNIVEYRTNPSAS